MAEKSKEVNYAEMDNDQLIKTVKDRDKKLRKVESKFLEGYEERRKLKTDRDTFLNFLTLIFPEETLQEVLLPEDQVGHYDIDHLRNFWQLTQSKQAASQLTESDNYQKEIESLKEQLVTHEELTMKVEGLESTLELLQKSENELKAENATLV